ncbi:MAG: cysteine--tRNA ligase, partial [Clostridiales bacterium]|nr:cysteine--tRNA ligase [Clostridiales bacterium]
LWTMVKEPFSHAVYELALDFDKVLGLDLHTAHATETADNAPAPAEVVALAEKRLAARKQKNWAESDRLRDEIAALGYTVADSKDGYSLRKQ